MKRQIQKTGVRKYFGDDLVALQSEPLRAIDALCGSSGQCIIDGCDISPAAGGRYNVSRGMVALHAKDDGGADRVMVMPFAGAEDVVLPIYLTVRSTAEERVYGDGRVKPIAYDYRAVAAGVKPADGVPFMEVTAAGGNRFVDVMQDALHRFATDAEKAAWNSKAPGNHNHDDRYSNYVHPSDANTRHVTDAEKAAWNGKAPGNHNHDDRYSNYVHPSDTNTRHVTDAEKAAWNGKAAGNHSHTGLMSDSERNKLSAVSRLQVVAIGTCTAMGMDGGHMTCNGTIVTPSQDNVHGIYYIVHNFGLTGKFYRAQVSALGYLDNKAKINACVTRYYPGYFEVRVFDTVTNQTCSFDFDYQIVAEV